MMRGWMFQVPWDKFASLNTTVDTGLIGAIIFTESSGNPLAARYEPGYKYLNNPKNFAAKLGITEATETILQQMSYGLMQIMGATARDQGFDGPLSLLFDPEVNLKWGIKYLEKLCAKYPDLAEAIASYNAGSPKYVGDYGDRKFVNQSYVDKVMPLYLEIKK